ncbi:MAG: dipeptidase [Roseburia sp.]|nr:dipeptidase [Roseburia sp.]
MFIADLHCDTLSALYTKERLGESVNLMENDLQLDVKKMERGNYILQNFAVFVDWGEEEPYVCAKEQIRLFSQQTKLCEGKLRQARTFQEMEENARKGIISAVLTLEEGEICQGDLRKLEEMYQFGARMMTFTWNYENSLASPANPDDRRTPVRGQGGLTEIGIAFLEKMEELGMIVDVSHLSDEGIADVLKYSKKRIAASHSNSRSLCSHPRNLRDEQIRSIAEKGGIIGVNYYGSFLTEKETGGVYFSRVEDIARHMEHMVQTGGIGCVGLGSDFDGMDDNLELKGAFAMELLWEALRKRGFTESEVEAVCYKNVWEFYREML